MTSQREIRVEIPASKRANERASEQAMESRKTHPGLSANRARRERNRKWWRRKERASNPTRSRRQNTARVSLFFINRLIGKDTSSLPPYLVLPFHPCFISSNSSSPFLRFLLFPSLAGRPYSLFLFSPFHRQIYPLSSEPSVSLFRQLLPRFLHLVSRSKPPPPPYPGDDEEEEAFVTRFWSTSSFFLAILFNFFFRSGGNPFITRAHDSSV